MYEEKTPLQMAVGAIRMMRGGYNSDTIRRVAKMYGIKVSDLKPLLKGNK